LFHRKGPPLERLHGGGFFCHCVHGWTGGFCAKTVNARTRMIAMKTAMKNASGGVHDGDHDDCGDDGSGCGCGSGCDSGCGGGSVDYGGDGSCSCCGCCFVKGRLELGQRP